MENLGWLQGSVVKREDAVQILELAGKHELLSEPEVILVVASGSCDIANSSDPIVEFSIARYIDRLDGNFTYNKNPRRLQCNLESASSSQVHIELKAHEKIGIQKDDIPEGIMPNFEIKFTQKELDSYVDWLVARYRRPAFPTEFDRRIDAVWDKSKRKKLASKVSAKLMGIYAKVYPDREISESENYSVDLLAITVPNSNATEKAAIENFINQYKQALLDAGMDVGTNQIVTEYQVSVGTFKEYKRFNLDELSYKSDNPLPSEINLP